MKTMNETRVLVVDAEPVACENLRLFFRLRGIKARSAASGESALCKLAEKPYDLVICNIELPGMNGLELMRKIHVDHPQVPVILMAASSDPKLREEAFAWDAADFLSRPLDPDDLALAIEAALNPEAETVLRAALAESEMAVAV